VDPLEFFFGSPAGVADRALVHDSLWPRGFAAPAFAECALVGDLRGDPDPAVFCPASVDARQHTR